MASQDPTTKPRIGDAFGQALLGHLDPDGDPLHIVEREDGLVEAMATELYFGGPDAWSPHEATLLESAGDETLDIGAGAGRVSLALNARGKRVTALDVSEGAIEVCRRREVAETHLGSVETLEPGPRFDTFVLFGNNLGLLESRDHAPRFLAALRAIALPNARILGSCLDPYRTSNPEHLQYQAHNRERGRLSGQIRLRTRYRQLTTEWHDYLFVSVDELAGLAEPAGWMIEEVAEDDGPVYAAILRMR